MYVQVFNICIIKSFSDFIDHVAHMGKHNYCVVLGDKDSVEMSSATEGSTKSGQVKNYASRSMRCPTI